MLKQIFKAFFKVKQPDGVFRVSVDMISLILIVYEILEIPLMLSFPEIVDSQLEFMANFITFYFIAEICMSFNTAFYRRGIIVKKRKQIAKNYLMSWLFLGKLY